MPNHYWVTTPEVLSSWDYEEPQEDFRIFECVEAKNKREARSAFVKKQYKEWKEHTYHSRDGNWFYHIGNGENPFVGLNVEQALCKHGVCLCDNEDCKIGKPRDPKSDWCKDCNEEYDRDHFMTQHNALSESKCPLTDCIWSN